MFDLTYRCFALRVAVSLDTICACILLGIVTGAFTEVLLKFLKVVGLDLNDLANAVTKEMKDKYGIKQMPVSAHMTSRLS